MNTTTQKRREEKTKLNKAKIVTARLVSTALNLLRKKTISISTCLLFCQPKDTKNERFSIQRDSLSAVGYKKLTIIYPTCFFVS